ncbi:putative ribonuclease H-like domain-containing protein, partial [Tanacetum coccineum]
PKSSPDDEKKVDDDQEKGDNVNSTNNVNAAGIEVNDVGAKTSIELRVDPNMHTLKDYSIFDSSSDGQDGGAEADMNNLDTTIQVSSNPTIRIHKDHHLDQVIGDLQSATQTRNMTKNLEEYGYPLDEAVIVAMSTIKEHYIDINEVHFLLFADGIYNVWVEKAKELLPNLACAFHNEGRERERVQSHLERNETNKKHEEWGGDQGYNENGTVQVAYVLTLESIAACICC